MVWIRGFWLRPCLIAVSLAGSATPVTTQVDTLRTCSGDEDLGDPVATVTVRNAPSILGVLKRHRPALGLRPDSVVIMMGADSPPWRACVSYGSGQPRRMAAMVLERLRLVPQAVGNRIVLVVRVGNPSEREVRGDSVQRVESSHDTVFVTSTVESIARAPARNASSEERAVARQLFAQFVRPTGYPAATCLSYRPHPRWERSLVRSLQSDSALLRTSQNCPPTIASHVAITPPLVVPPGHIDPRRVTITSLFEWAPGIWFAELQLSWGALGTYYCTVRTDASRQWMASCVAPYGRTVS
jgi:hypothetical protein